MLLFFDLFECQSIFALGMATSLVQAFPSHRTLQTINWPFTCTATPTQWDTAPSTGGIHKPLFDEDRRFM